MSVKPLESIPKFDGHALRHRCENDPRVQKMHISGDHVIAEGPRGIAVFPDRDMGDGLWCKVIKTFRQIGLGILILFVGSAILSLFFAY